MITITVVVLFLWTVLTVVYFFSRMGYKSLPVSRFRCCVEILFSPPLMVVAIILGILRSAVVLRNVYRSNRWRGHGPVAALILTYRWHFQIYD